MIDAVKFKYFQKRDILVAIGIYICLWVVLGVAFFHFYPSQYIPEKMGFNYDTVLLLGGWFSQVVLFPGFFVKGILYTIVRETIGIAYKPMSLAGILYSLAGVAAFFADVFWWVFVIQVIKGWRRRKKA